MSTPRIRRRSAGQPETLPVGLPAVLRRVYASRGLSEPDLGLELRQLLPPQGLKGIEDAAALLEDAIRTGKKIVIAGDYDADGATATALGLLGLRALGAEQTGYVVPDRFRMGYGLSPALVDVAVAQSAQLLVTVDNGIASNAGVAHAKALGLPVLITDHHLPGQELPDAAGIVNPNQPGCGFVSKHLAGVGVMFYVLLALRARLRASGGFAQRAEPNLADWLDLVAVGTVADVVRLDHNNRVLVEQGLRRIRAGRCRPGLRALLEVAGRSAERISSTDLGFVIGPRINAAGRLEDIRVGIECLLAEDATTALALARQLDAYNRERREIEAQMRDDADLLVQDSTATGVSLFDESWHEGVVGLVASRIKERLHRPVIAFAQAQEPGLLKGSGRSISGLHLRDALAFVDAQRPGLIQRFGGHAMAAGLTLDRACLDEFSAAFDAVCQAWLSQEQLEKVIESDGELDNAELSLETAALLENAGPWGQGFGEPVFEGFFEVTQARLIGSAQNHAKYQLRSGAVVVAAVDFGGAERLVTAGHIHAVYRLAVNRWQGRESLDLQIVRLESVR